MSVTISVSNHDALVDEVISIVIQGLSKNQAVTVHAIIVEKNIRFGSSGCFYADDNGMVDMTKQRSEAGTYKGVSPMGLFWSMKSAPGEELGRRIIKSNASTPLNVTLKVCEGHISFDDLYTDSPKELASLQFRRWYLAKGVKRIKVRIGRIRGALFLPPGPGPFIGIIDMFGVAGSLIDFRAALLASRGFAVLSLAYFLYDDLPKFIGDVELEYFLEAINWLSDRSEVISDNIGIIGVSKGGEIALHAAYYSSKVKAIVSINGAPFFTGDPLTYQGQHIGQSITAEENIIGTEEGNIYRHCLLCDKENFLAIWEKDMKVMLIAGGDDQTLDPKHLKTLEHCYPDHKKQNCTLLYYPGAGHLIEPPYAPMCRTTRNTVKGYKEYESLVDVVLWGGSVEEHAFAQEDAWKNTLEFFRNHLSPSLKEKKYTSSKL